MCVCVCMRACLCNSAMHYLFGLFLCAVGNSVLHLAAMFGFPEITKYLITKHSTSVNEKDLVCPMLW